MWALKLKNAGVNYNPYTYTSMIEAQENGAVYTNEELRGLVENQDLKLKEAVALGYQPDKLVSVTTENLLRLEETGTYRELNGVADGLINNLLNQLDITSQDKTMLMVTQGDALKRDVLTRLESSINKYIKNNPEASEDDLISRVNILKTKFEKEFEGISFDSNTQLLTGYDIGGQSDLPYSTVEELTKLTHKNPKGEFIRILSNRSIAGLEIARSEVRLDLDHVLTGKQIALAIANRSENKPYPTRVVEVAKALGTSPAVLIRLQGKAYDFPEWINYKDPMIVQQVEAGTLEITRDNISELSREAIGRSITWRQLGRNPTWKQQILNYYQIQQ